jgi:hypothetical protein
LQAETAEDLEEWKASLEKAISAAPNADLMTGQSGIFKNDSIDAGDGPTDTGTHTCLLLIDYAILY